MGFTVNNMANMGMSGFFGSNASGNSNDMGITGSLNLSDLNLIKSGSYGKLMKAYYAQDSEEGTSVKDKTDKLLATKESAIKSDADALSKAAGELQDKSLYEKKEIKDKDGNTKNAVDMDKLYSKVKNFVDSYNDLITSGQKSKSTSALTSTAGMVMLTDATSRTLSSIGITVGSNNKLSLDEEDFKKASAGTVKALFGSKGDYGWDVAGKASSVSNAISSELGLKNSYTSAGNYNTTMADVMNRFNTTT